MNFDDVTPEGILLRFLGHFDVVLCCSVLCHWIMITWWDQKSCKSCTPGSYGHFVYFKQLQGPLILHAITRKPLGFAAPQLADNSLTRRAPYCAAKASVSQPAPKTI